MLPIDALEVQKEKPAMKKHNTCPQESKGRTHRGKPAGTIGMDLGDKVSRYCWLDADGEVVEEGRVAMSKAGMARVFGSMKRRRIALEVGTHSPWVSRLLSRWP